jgi:hypothetical protein
MRRLRAVCTGAPHGAVAMVLACVSFVAQGHMAGLGACVRGFDCGAAVRRPAMRLGPCCSTLSRDAATAAVLQLRGGGDDPGRKVRRRKRRHKQKDIFVDDSSARRKHVPVSAQLKRLRGEIKDIKRPEDAPRFVKDSSVGAVEDGAGEHRRTGPGELSSGTGRLQERQVELRHKAWRAKLKRQKEQAFILKKKLERQRLEVKQLQQQYLRPGGALESQQVPMVAGVALQEEFATPLAKHLLPASALTQGRQVGQTSKHTDLEVPEESGTKKSPGAIGVAGPAIPHAPGGHHAAAAAKSAPSMVLDGSDTRDAGRMLVRRLSKKICI